MIHFVIVLSVKRVDSWITLLLLTQKMVQFGIPHFPVCGSPIQMSDPRALEIASQTVYYDESGKRVSRREYLARMAKDKKVKVDWSRHSCNCVDSWRACKGTLRVECGNIDKTTRKRTTGFVIRCRRPPVIVIFRSKERATHSMQQVRN